MAAFVLLLIVRGVSAYAQPPAPGSAAAVAALPSEWAIFAEKGCARCHRVRGMGDGSAGADLGRVGAGRGFYEIGAAMWNDLPRMRQQAREQNVEWPRLSAQDLSNVVALLFTAQGWNDRGDPVVGERLFASKGCERCHATRNGGGSTGPPLAELGRSISPMRLAAAMWNHGTQMGEAMEAGGVRPARLVGTESPDLMAYVLTAGRESRREAAPTMLGLAERGARLFAEKGCARCHAFGGMSSPSAPRLGPHTPRATVSDLAGRLWNHGPAWRADRAMHGIKAPRLTAQEVADITGHLYANFYFDDLQGNGRRGERLVRDKGCLRCHSIYNKGGRLAPDFATSNVVSSAVAQLSAMWNHGRQMEDLAKRRTLVLARLTAQELADITRYLAGLGGGARVGPPRSK